MATDAQKVKSLNAWIARASRLRTPDQFRSAIKDLPTIFSRESVLRELILIRLLEVIEAPPQRKRAKSDWQKFVSREMKAGRTITEAALRWRGQSTQTSGGDRR